MISRSLAVAIVFALVLFAYPLLASLMSMFNVGDTRFPSIVMRVSTAVAAIVTFWVNRESIRVVSPAFTIAFFVFWSIYLYRIVSDGYIAEIDMQIPANELLAYSIMFSILPSLVGLIGINLKSSHKAFNISMVLAAIALILMLMETQRLVFSVVSDGANRFSLEKLDPIAVSKIGAAVFLLSLYGLFSQRIGAAPVRRVLFMLGLAAGLAGMLLGASRGSFLAVAVACLAFAIAPMKSGRLLTSVLVFGVSGYVLAAMYQFSLNQFSFDVLGRFLSAVDGYDASTIARQETIASAYQQFLDNPIFGDSIAENVFGYYPHNSIAEAFMATGIVGGGAYLFALAASSVAALRLIGRREGYEWLALMSILFAVMAQVNGAHWSNGPHWFTMFAVVVTEIKSRRRPNTAQIRTEAPAERFEFEPASGEELSGNEPPRDRKPIKGFPTFTNSAQPERGSTDTNS